MKIVYLDNNATTKPDPRVVAAMLPWFEEHYANASSVQNPFGLFASRAVEKARETIASFFGAKPNELVFTGGASESINTAIKGAVELTYPLKNHLIVSKIEHPSTLAVCKYLEKKGIQITYLDVDSEGYIDLEQLTAAITDRTALVSIIAANNEIGTIQDLDAITKIVKKRDCLLHLDFAQGNGRVELDLRTLMADLVSFSAHKSHGPKGIGALFIRESLQKGFPPLIHGGDQELGLRGGTLNVPLIVGFKETVTLLTKEKEVENQRMAFLNNALYEGICSNIKNVYLNGPLKRRLVTNCNVLLPDINANKLLRAVKNVAFSTASACATLSTKPSHVLLAIGRTREEAQSCFRFGVSRFTTPEEIQYAVEAIALAAKNSYK